MGDKIICKICSKEFKTITQGHLKKHDTNLKEYERIYGNCKTQTNTGKTHFRKEHSPWNMGKERSKKTKKKISETNKGRIVWNKGKKLSDKHKRGLSKAHKGKKLSQETRKKISKTLKGVKFTEERKKKISESLKGRKLSKKHIEKISKTWFEKNHVPWNKNRAWDEEIKKKISSLLREVVG